MDSRKAYEQIKEEIVEKIVSDSEVFSSDDLVEIMENSKTTEDEEGGNDEEKTSIGEKDIWNIDSIVKKKSGNSKKHVLSVNFQRGSLSFRVKNFSATLKWVLPR